MWNKGVQIAWNTTVGFVFLGIIAATMAANSLLEDR
jgi:hypothetical protein